MGQVTNGIPPGMSDEEVTRIGGLLLGVSNDLSESRALILKQAAAMLDYFAANRRRAMLEAADAIAAPALTFDPTLIERVPSHIVTAARALTAWFAEQGISEWKLDGVQNRVDTPGVAIPLKAQE